MTLLRASSIFLSPVFMYITAVHGLVVREAVFTGRGREQAGVNVTSLSAPPAVDCDKSAKNVCGKSVELCGTLANGGHNGATKIFWARPAASGSPVNLLVKTTLTDGGPECELQKILAGAHVGPKCFAACSGEALRSEGFDRAGAVVLEAVFREHTTELAPPLNAAMEEWKEDGTYEQNLQKVLRPMLVTLNRALDAGLMNLDSNAGNVLVVSARGKSPKVKFIDFDPQSGAGKVPKEKISEDLRGTLGKWFLSLAFCPVDGLKRDEAGNYIVPASCEPAKTAAVQAASSIRDTDRNHNARSVLLAFSKTTHYGDVAKEHMQDLLPLLRA